MAVRHVLVRSQARVRPVALRNGGPLARVPLVVGARVAPERPVVVASRVRLLEPLVVLISPVVGIRRGLLRPVTPRAVLGRRNVPLPLVAPTFVSNGVTTPCGPLRL